MDTLDLIKQYGISIRQVPLSIRHVQSISHIQEGDEIIEQKVQHVNYRPFKENRYGSADFRFDDDTQTVYRRYCIRYSVPDKAGWWMAKLTEHTSSTVKWSYADDNLSPTLEEAVKKLVDKIITHS